MEVEIKDAKIACLSGIIDLQRTCQREHVKFSPETNKYLLYLTLKKVGASVAQKLVSKLAERGDIPWDQEENWEVERILDHVLEEEIDYYYIKWKGWSNIHNTWEPKDNLNCYSLLEEFHSAKAHGKRRLPDADDDLPDAKRSRVDEIFSRLTAVRDTLSPLQLLSVSSPQKDRQTIFKGLISSGDIKVNKLITGTSSLNPRSRGYRQRKVEVAKALKDWEKQLNAINTDPAQIVVENSVDIEGPPDNFEYINDYRAGEGLEIPSDPLVGCECEDCYENKKHCCPKECGAEFAYYKHKRLRVPKGTPIYECNKRCKCGPECPNRVVQQGRKFKVCIFRTANGRGWGVKTLQKIKRGSFVFEYVGEVITSEEAERRGKEYDAVGRTYLFDLDYNDGDCPFTVDAGYYGNVSHFVNHSCDPNLEVYGVWINTLDPRLPRIALFSKRDIEKGEELTFDYMMTGATVGLESTDKDGLVPEVLAQEVTENMESGDATSVKMETGEETSVNTEAGDTASTKDEAGLPDKPNDLTVDETTLPNEAGDNNTDKTDPIEIPSELGSEAENITLGGDDVEELVSETEISSPPTATDQYRIVCQCGAKNCRKYLF